MDFTGIFQGLSMNYATGKQTASFELNEDAREAFQDLKGCEKLTIQIEIRRIWFRNSHSMLFARERSRQCSRESQSRIGS